MCGIVVALAFGKLNKKKESERQRIMRYLTTKLLIETESRGKDATGAAILFADGNFVGMKRGDKPTDFLSKLGKNKDCYGGLGEIWKAHESDVKVYLGHARTLSQGPKEDNENNHPIKIGNIVGIHNGHIKNDDEIFKNLGCKRDGKVDSEAIFRLFEHFTSKGSEPFTLDMIQEIVNRLEGQFAVTLFNGDNPYQVPVFRDGKPVEFVFIKDYKLLFMISEMGFWNKVIFHYEIDIFEYDLNMPSLLQCKIDKKQLEDDSCIIFDLTTNKITKETEIKDLGEWGKISRIKKIWKTTTTTYTTGYSRTGYHGSASTPTTGSKKEEINPKEKRVFNKILKKYVASASVEKGLADDKSITLPTSTNSQRIENITTTDKEEQDKPTKEVEIRDLTVYDKEKDGNVGEKKDDDTPISEDDVDSGLDAEENNGNIIDVDMGTEAPELVAAAEEQYKELHMLKKGYGTVEELSADIEVDNLENKSKLTIANRVFAESWKKGFIYSYKYILNERKDEKIKSRSIYIYGLKSLVMLLASFFNHQHSLGSTAYKEVIAGRLSTIAMGQISKNDKALDMESLRKLFSDPEMKRMVNVNKIITNAAKCVGSVEDAQEEAD